MLQQVITDLIKAQTLLNINYVDAKTDTATTIERVRPNKSVATALLARAYLYLGDYNGKNIANYADAETQATTVINDSRYSLSPVTGVFLKNSAEAIWQLQTALPAGSDTPDGILFILISAPQTGQNNYTTISSQLMGSFEPNDQRQNNWIGNYTATGPSPVTYYFPYKYRNYTLKSQEYTMVLRLGEQYLIRAEAEAQENKLAAAATDLNIIRARAGLPPTSATTQSALLAAIQHERQVELFTEWGHRWFDLQRTGNANNVMSIVCPQKGGSWSSDGHQQLFPIPQADIATDHNLTQNAGY